MPRPEPLPECNYACRIGLCAGLCLLVGCASQPPPTSQEQIVQAQKTYSDCLHRAAANLDSESLDVAPVAVAVRDYCTPEYQRLVDVYGRHLDSQARKRLLQKAQTTQLDDAVEIVLQERVSRKRVVDQP